MSRADYMTFTSRLSCGCLTDYYLPPNIGAEVMCMIHAEPATIKSRYPSLSSTCGTIGKVQGLDIPMRCTNKKPCNGKPHHDGPEALDFNLKPRLRSSAEGNTGYA